MEKKEKRIENENKFDAEAIANELKSLNCSDEDIAIMIIGIKIGGKYV